VKRKKYKLAGNTAPGGSGFLIIEETSVRPPVLVFLGQHADIDLSSTIHIDWCIKSCI